MKYNLGAMKAVINYVEENVGGFSKDGKRLDRLASQVSSAVAKSLQLSKEDADMAVQRCIDEGFLNAVGNMFVSTKIFDITLKGYYWLKSESKE